MNDPARFDALSFWIGIGFGVLVVTLGGAIKYIAHSHFYGRNV